MHENQKKFQLSSFIPFYRDNVNVPYYDGEDPFCPLDLFLYSIEHEGKMRRWKPKDYATCVLNRLKGKAKIEFMKNPDYMNLTWNQIQNDLWIKWVGRTNNVTNFYMANSDPVKRLSK